MLRAFIILLAILFLAPAVLAEDQYSVNRQVIIVDEEGNEDEVKARGLNAGTDYRPNYQSNGFQRGTPGRKTFSPDFDPVYVKPDVVDEEEEYLDVGGVQVKLPKPVQDPSGKMENPYTPGVARHPAANIEEFRRRQLNPAADAKPVEASTPSE